MPVRVPCADAEAKAQASGKAYGDARPKQSVGVVAIAPISSHNPLLPVPPQADHTLVLHYPDSFRDYSARIQNSCLGFYDIKIGGAMYKIIIRT